jgi:glutamate racemase
VSFPRIGVFDSGVGGLTVLKAISEQMPEQYLYFGDTARLPYGTKSAETVARYSIRAAHFLESQDIDLLVVACNSATALALPKIRQAAHIPVVGVVEPGAAMAAEVSKTRAAIVIATEATVSSHAYRDALQQHGLHAYEKACPLLVPLVEEGWIDHPVTEQVAKIYLSEAMGLASNKADVLVLACTHYPLIAPVLRRITPGHVQIVDSAQSTARVVKQRFEADVAGVTGIRSGSSTSSSAASGAKHRTFRFYVTDSVEKFKSLATRFLGRQVDHVEHVDLGG